MEEEDVIDEAEEVEDQLEAAEDELTRIDRLLILDQNSYQTDGSMTFLTATAVSEEDGIVVLAAASPPAVNFIFPTWILVFLIQIFRSCSVSLEL